MPKQHTVQAGECISSIADRYGFFPDTIWNDPGNAGLKSKRDDANVLADGDVLTIPDKREKIESRPTGASHRFQKKCVPSYLRMQVFDEETPRAFQPFTILVDGVEQAGTTDGEGVLRVPVPPRARRATLTVGAGDSSEVFELRLGYLDPVDQMIGVQARLCNLGFLCDENGVEDAATQAALKAFQKRHGLTESGTADAATRDKLKQVHDNAGRFAPAAAEPEEAEAEQAASTPSDESDDG